MLFGPWNPENVQQFDTVKFEQRPIEGHMIEFEDKAKQSLYGVVKTVVMTSPKSTLTIHWQVKILPLKLKSSK